MKFLLALGLIAAAIPARAICTTGGAPLNLEIPSFNDSGDVWSGCLKRDLQKISTTTLSGTVSGQTTFTSSVTMQADVGLATLSGKVGIGTASPGAALDAEVAITTTAIFAGGSPVTGVGGNSGAIQLGNNNTVHGTVQYDANVSNALYIDNSFNNNASDIIFRAKTNATPVEIMRLRGSGNVGIGTAGPGAILHVLGSGTLGNDLWLDIPAAQQFVEQDFRVGGVLKHTNYWDNFANTFHIQTAVATSSIAFDINGATKMLIDRSGNVGIGTANPAAPLDVNGNTIIGSVTADPVPGTLQVNGTVRLLGTASLPNVSSVTYGNNTNSDGIDFYPRNDASKHIHFDGNGNVGIGQTNPSQKLDVNGTIYSESGGFKFPDGTVQTTANGSVAASSGSTSFFAASAYTTTQTSFQQSITGSTISFTVQGTTVACWFAGSEYESGAGNASFALGIMVDGSVSKIPGTSGTVGVSAASMGTAGQPANMSFGPIEFQVTGSGASHTFSLGTWTTNGGGTAVFPSNQSIGQFGCREVLSK